MSRREDRGTTTAADAARFERMHSDDDRPFAQVPPPATLVWCAVCRATRTGACAASALRTCPGCGGHNYLPGGDAA